MQELFKRSGILQTAELLQQKLDQGVYDNVNRKLKDRKKKGKSNSINYRIPQQVDSEITIYRNAVTDGQNKSSSSEEGLNNTSDETLEINAEEPFNSSGEDMIDL